MPFSRPRSDMTCAIDQLQPSLTQTNPRLLSGGLARSPTLQFHITSSQFIVSTGISYWYLTTILIIGLSNLCTLIVVLIVSHRDANLATSAGPFIYLYYSVALQGSGLLSVITIGLWLQAPNNYR